MAGPRILAVRLGAMGDIIHTLPAVATLKHSFPHCQVCWAVEPKWAPLLVGNPFLDEVILCVRSGLSAMLETRKRLRAKHFDFAVDFQGLLKSALVASAARPEKIFGYHSSQVREKLAALIYSKKVRTNSAHIVDRNIELAVSTGAANIVKAFPLPPGQPEGDLPPGGFVLASPLAGWPAKQWPLEFYWQLARLLRERFGLPLVLNGPLAALEQLRAVAGTVAHSSGIEGLIDVTRRATAVVGVDSGPMHLAAALEKPGVAIFGPTDPARNGPYCASMSVLRAPDAVTTYKRHHAIDASMRAITPEAVIAALAVRLEPRAFSSGISL